MVWAICNTGISAPSFERFCARTSSSCSSNCSSDTSPQHAQVLTSLMSFAPLYGILLCLYVLLYRKNKRISFFSSLHANGAAVFLDNFLCNKKPNTCTMHLAALGCCGKPGKPFEKPFFVVAGKGPAVIVHGHLGHTAQIARGNGDAAVLYAVFYRIEHQVVDHYLKQRCVGRQDQARINAVIDDHALIVRLPSKGVNRCVNNIVFQFDFSGKKRKFRLFNP